jgi:hypothetical protein
MQNVTTNSSSVTTISESVAHRAALNATAETVIDHFNGARGPQTPSCTHHQCNRSNPRLLSRIDGISFVVNLAAASKGFIVNTTGFPF